MRVDSARLLVDPEAEAWVSINRGIVLHVSFFKEATSAGLRRALRQLLKLPLLSRGQWGDDQAPESILKLSPVDVMIVPQANLTGRASGNTIRYDNQLDKTEAQRIYAEFCDELKSCSTEMLAPAAVLTPEQLKAEQLRRQARNAEHPQAMFQSGEYEGKYSSFDERGVPLTDADGAPLSKAQSKKLEKFFKARLAKYQKAQGKEKIVQEVATCEGVTVGESASMEMPAGAPGEVENLCCLPRFVCGVFGNRQGFECVSAGPTIHCLDL